MIRALLRLFFPGLPAPERRAVVTNWGWGYTNKPRTYWF